MLIMNSILIEPVVNVGFEIDVISKVSGPGGADEEAMLIGHGVVITKLLGLSFSVLGYQSKVE